MIFAMWALVVGIILSVLFFVFVALVEWWRIR